MDNRLSALCNWFEQATGEKLLSIEPASEDASFRRYFRVKTKDQSFVVMDAPPEKESISDFIRIDTALIAQNVHAPKIFHQSLELGFLCLEDLGGTTYLDELASNSQILYSRAIDALIDIQRGTYDQPEFLLPDYDTARLTIEMDLFDEWYVGAHLELVLSESQKLAIQESKKFLIDTCLEQPQIWVHRDYHSRNLMISEPNPAVIDFQDMMRGPIAYDLASLFKDCYIRWPRERQIMWCKEYHDKSLTGLPNLSHDFDTLLKWFDLTGLQRHLKVLGIFCRLNYRDSKAQYLEDLPLVESYVEEVTALYPELEQLAKAIGPIFETAREQRRITLQ